MNNGGPGLRSLDMFESNYFKGKQNSILNHCHFD